jgi:hypothetical protein
MQTWTLSWVRVQVQVQKLRARAPGVSMAVILRLGPNGKVGQVEEARTAAKRRSLLRMLLS